MALFGSRACIPEDMEKMQQALDRNMYDQWEEAYSASLPGGLSTDTIMRRFYDPAILEEERVWAERARRDIEDFAHASPQYELRLGLNALALSRGILHSLIDCPTHC